MEIFIQGMRRSGTTILFDIFANDPQFNCYYEPFAGNREAWGGGSEARKDINYSEKILDIKQKFIAHYSKSLNLKDLNYGAPYHPFLEFLPNLPEYAIDYLHFLLGHTNPNKYSLVKFTRMYNKIEFLSKNFPNSFLVHIVRDPRRVTTSYLLGKNKSTIFANQNDFFTQKLPLKRWACYSLSEILLSSKYQHLKECEDYLRVLLLWKHTFLKTYQGGKTFFAHKYILLRHEDLCAQPEHTIHSIYQTLDLEPSKKSLNWLKHNIKLPSSIFAPHHPEWTKAFDLLDLQETMQLAGYT